MKSSKIYLKSKREKWDIGSTHFTNVGMSDSKPSTFCHSRMSSKIRLACHWCPETFENQRDLKNHAATDAHNMLRVICPWCYSEEKTYRRISELLRHVNSRHDNLTIEGKTDFFNESIGFWLAINPEGYQKLVQPKDVESIQATKARAAVYRWLTRVKYPTRTKDQWEASWALTSWCRPVPPRQPTGYTPTHPSIDEELQLASLSFTSAGNVAHLQGPAMTSRTVWYKAVLAKDVFDDKRAADNLIRRMAAHTTAGGIPETFDCEIKEGGPLMTAVAKQLGIGERHIKHVFRRVIRFESNQATTGTTGKKRKLEAELGMDDDITLEELITPPVNPLSPIKTPPRKKKTNSGKSTTKTSAPKRTHPEDKEVTPAKASANTTDVAKARTPSTPELPTPVISIPTVPTPEQPIQGTKESPPVLPPTKASTTSTPSSAGSPNATVVEPSTQKPADNQTPTPTRARHPASESTLGTTDSTIHIEAAPKSQAVRNPSAAVTTGEPSSTPGTEDTILIVEDDEPEQRVPSVPEVRMVAQIQTSEGPVTPTQKVADQVPALTAVRTIRERADLLLQTGVMPMLPPGHRNWTGIQPIALCDAPTTVTWPPEGWETFTAEEKLTAWEFAAMALEYQRGVAVVCDIAELLDKYAFLCLPGTAVEKSTPREDKQLRFKNFVFVKNIYLGKVRDTEARKWLDVYEAARTGCDRSAEEFGIQKLDHVPLRLTADDATLN